MTDLLTAVSLIFVLEGLVLFISPSRLKQALALLMSHSEKDIKTVGLVSMVAGAVLLYLVR